MSTFTVISGSDERPNWLEMRPAHFDRDKLPRKHRKPEPEGLFPLADVVPTWKTPGKPDTQLDGQAELFSGLD